MPADIKHHAAIPKNTRGTDIALYLRRSGPVGRLYLSIPSHHRLARVGIGGAAIEKALKCGERDDPHANADSIVPRWDQGEIGAG